MNKYFIHESSYIDSDVEIGAETKIWHFCHILQGSSIGEGCTLGQNVVVGPRVKVGNKVKIQNNVSVFEGVTLEDNVFCGPSCVFTNVINPRSEINRKEEFRQTVVKKGVTIGANATIICGNSLGEYSFIAAGAVVNTEVKPYALMVGVPAIQIGWMSRYGERIDLPIVREGEWKCKNTGVIYKLTNKSFLKCLSS